MKPIVIIAIAFVFLFVPTSILAQESLTTYENDEYGFMIDYPIHWTVDKLIFDLPSVIGSSDGGKSIVGFNDEEAGVFVEIMFLKNEDIAQNFEGDDYVNQRKIESKLFCNQSTLSSGFDYTCSDYELKSSSHDDDVYTMTESMIHQYSNGDIKKMIHFQQEIIKNDYVWMLRLDSSEETFDEIYPTIMNMYNSFTLVDSNHNLHEYEIPGWVKNNIKLFGEDKISDSQFFESLEYLIEQGIVPLPFDARNVESTDIPIPEWIKNNARWWSDDMINDFEFVKGLEYLTEEEILPLPETYLWVSPELNFIADSDLVIEFNDSPIDVLEELSEFHETRLENIALRTISVSPIPDYSHPSITMKVVDDAIQSWESLNPGLKFESGSDNPNVIISVKWVTLIDPMTPYMGIAKQSIWTYDDGSEIMHFKILIDLADSDCNGNPIFWDKDAVTDTIAHELGHALEIFEHSSDESNLMYAAGDGLDYFDTKGYTIPERNPHDYYIGQKESGNNDCFENSVDRYSPYG